MKSSGDLKIFKNIKNRSLEILAKLFKGQNSEKYKIFNCSGKYTDFKVFVRKGQERIQLRE